MKRRCWPCLCWNGTKTTTIRVPRDKIHYIVGWGTGKRASPLANLTLFPLHSSRGTAAADSINKARMALSLFSSWAAHIHNMLRCCRSPSKTGADTLWWSYLVDADEIKRMGGVPSEAVLEKSPSRRACSWDSCPNERLITFIY